MKKLEPIVDMIGGTAIEHGERGDLDPANQYACLCGVRYYMDCDGPGLETFTIHPDFTLSRTNG